MGYSDRLLTATGFAADISRGRGCPAPVHSRKARSQGRHGVGFDRKARHRVRVRHGVRLCRGLVRGGGVSRRAGFGRASFRVHLAESQTDYNAIRPCRKRLVSFRSRQHCPPYGRDPQQLLPSVSRGPDSYQASATQCHLDQEPESPSTPCGTTANQSATHRPSSRSLHVGTPRRPSCN